MGSIIIYLSMELMLEQYIIPSPSIDKIMVKKSKPRAKKISDDTLLLKKASEILQHFQNEFELKAKLHGS